MSDSAEAVRRHCGSPDPVGSESTPLRGSESLVFGRFLLSFRAKEQLRFPPFKGATLRGGLGFALKRISCPPISRRKCPSCLLNGECAYSYLFETPNTRDGDLLKGVSYAPHPFVLRPPMSDRELYDAGDFFEAEIILVGKALRLLPHVIYAFEEFGATGIGQARGKFVLEKVSGFCGQEWKQVYSSEDELLRERPWQRTMADAVGEVIDRTVDGIEVNFETPLRLKSDRYLVETLSFTTLITNLLRRIYLLDQWHCGGNLAFDHRALIELSRRVATVEQDLRWIDWERYSVRQEATLKMGGLVGRVRFQGPLTSFVPYLKLGEAVNVGKGTAFGLGMYTMTFCR